MIRDGMTPKAADVPATRILLLDDEPATLVIRSTVLRRQGYDCLSASTYEQAVALFDQIDIAVLDYHLGTGRFGSDVAVLLRHSRPEVPIIILSATLEHFFGGVEDMHLLKGYSSNENLVVALQAIDARRRGAAVVAEPSQFFYSRLCHAIGRSALIQVFDAQGRWLYCNEDAADYLGRERDWFPGHSPDEVLPPALHYWQEIILNVAARRETYIDRTRTGLLGGLLGTTDSSPDDPAPGKDSAWSVMAFPIALPDGQPGVVLTARTLEAHRAGAV